MPYIPHSPQDKHEMLQRIGVDSSQALFDEIPKALLFDGTFKLPQGLCEMELTQTLLNKSQDNQLLENYIGAGAYERFIPHFIEQVASRGEWLTAYTPYQAEASQGSLQLLFEYQSMMAHLMGMEVSNASLYEGGSALGEALLMATRLQKNVPPAIFVPETVNPFYRKTIKSLLSAQDIPIMEVPYEVNTGKIPISALEDTYQKTGRCSVLVIPMPNFLGQLEAVDPLVQWAESKGALTVAQVDPLAMAWLKPPGQWGDHGVDIACGEGQSLGIPLQMGGPYFGFLCARKRYVRQLPGRLVGRTQDQAKTRRYCLTLQAREQHIRRSKATSNICTNQGWLVAMATLYMAGMGPDGLASVAKRCHQNTQELVEQLAQIPKIDVLFSDQRFCECVIRCSKPAQTVIDQMAKRGIQAGFSLQNEYPELDNSLLVCVTETKTSAQMEAYARHLNEVLQS